MGTYMSGKNIIIAGAGMSGLSFARALRQLWPPELKPPHITIYERETKEGFRGSREGHSLSLGGFDKNTGGLVALRDLGLLDEVLRHATLGADGSKWCFKMWDLSWGELLSVVFKPVAEMPTGGLRIARKNLRQVLIDAVGPDKINWGVGCVSASKLDDGRMRVQLEGGKGRGSKTVDCDLLIVADGANSTLRASLRPDDTLQPTGVVQLGGKSVFPQGIPEPIAGNWGLLVSGTGAGCFIWPVNDTTLVWALSTKTQTTPQPVDRSDPAQVQSVLDDALALGSTIADPFQAIVAATDRTTVFRVALRDKKAFKHDDGAAVFVGDSNHAASAFSGTGANLALKDGWDLAEQLCGSASAAEGVGRYDAVAVPRAEGELGWSKLRISLAHATGLKHVYFMGIIRVRRAMLWMGMS